MTMNKIIDKNTNTSSEILTQGIEQEIIKDSLLTILDEVNILLNDIYKINYKEIYIKIRSKYKNLYMKERPEISPETINFLESPNKYRQIINFCDSYINSNYIKQSFN